MIHLSQNTLESLAELTHAFIDLLKTLAIVALFLGVGVALMHLLLAFA